MSIAISGPFADLKQQLDDASAALEETGDPTVRWRIDELERAIKITPPGNLCDCVFKLSVGLQASGTDDEDWASLRQVDEYMSGG